MLSVSIKSAACASTCAKMELVWPSCIRGYHVYGENWTAVLGEELNCEMETGNVVDRYAVGVKKPDTGETVGHVPKRISRMCSLFLQGYALTATVTGRRRYSSDLVQGGLEIPCNLQFVGDEKAIIKLKRVLKLRKCLKHLMHK